jgi:uncharacterized repeat protein (TIGR01451 family)
MSRNIIIMVITSSFLFISSAVSASELNYVPGEVLVQFNPKENGDLRSTEDKTEILSSFGGGTIVRSYKIVPGLSLVKLPQGTSVESALATFSTSSDITHVQPNYIYHTYSTFPNDPCGPVPNGGDQWGLHNIGQTGGTLDVDIDAPQAWGIATDSNIIVAVIDSGVDYTHPDLAANMWTDSNGHHGYDFHNNDNDPMDDCGHGTHCAGIIGAVGNNAKGMTGICWNVKIMALKLSDEFGGGFSTADAISCIEYAIDKGAKVLSNSWGIGYQYDGYLKSAIDAANSAGVLFIAAAGNYGRNNDSYPDYPSSYDCNNIISVMASDSNDERAVWWGQYSSNWGPNSVDLAAPGSNILSCALYGQYDYKDMTSMSAPFVAGACALVWSMNPSLSHLQVKNIILNSVDKKPALNGLCVTGGRLNLFNALAVVNASGLFLNKVDDINDSNGVMPGDYIHYTLSYRNPPVSDPNYIGDVNNAVITDFLPVDLAFISASGPNRVYYPRSNTVTWSIGTLEPNDSCSVTLTVRVNDCITEYGIITNLCKINGGNWTRWAREETPVLCASSPSPACGEIVDWDTGELNLTWYPGCFAADVNGHEVYFGTNFNDVHDANTSDPNVYKGTVTNPSYPIQFSNLDMDTTYYWRIDEVNTAVRWKGGVWSFKTWNYFIVENFDEYQSDADFYAVWKDYSDNGTGAMIYRHRSIDDVSLVHNKSINSMEYDFWNNVSPYYSEAYADIDDLPSHIGSDWTANGVESLSLYFYGQLNNDANKPMYVTLTDGASNSAKIIYNGDMNDIRDTSWHQWNIVLQEFVDNNNVNLADVSKITIGFGDGTNPSPAIGTGAVYFEDIRLYLERCIPGYYPAGDFDSDCDVDFYDFAIFALAWLTSSEQPNYNPVCDISVPRGIIDENDLARFCDYWLWQEGGETSMSSGFSELLYTAPPPEQPQPEVESESEPQPEQQQDESQGDYQQQSMLTGPNETPGIWLVYDGNMTPNSGDEITVYIHSDPMLLCMGTVVEVVGDANITTAMSEADCNSFGWDNDWNSDPYIDPSGWLCINGVSWECVVNGTVGYFKFRYNTGEVTVSIMEESCAYDANYLPVLFSLQPLIFGDPNQN